MKKSLKLISILLLSVVFLTGCFGDLDTDLPTQEDEINDGINEENFFEDEFFEEETNENDEESIEDEQIIE